MISQRLVPTRSSGFALRGAVWMVLGSAILGGCKTSADAREAALQMAQTAKALHDYYAAVEVIFEKTGELYALNHDLYGKPFPAATEAGLKVNEAELGKRAALAEDFSAVAESFSALSSSTAPADVAKAAGNLETEVASLAGAEPPSAAQTLLNGAVHNLVQAIQEHKEREAARSLASAVKGLRDLFDEEQEVWIAREHLYTGVAGNLAEALVDAGATNNLPLLGDALDPFGLTPAATEPADMHTGLQQAAKRRIADRTAAMDHAFGQATEDMSRALHTMAERVDAVAADKALDVHAAPITVGDVEQWAKHFLEG